MKRRILLAVAVAGALCETYRRGFAAPLLYGCRCWAAALDPRTITEPDYMA